MLDKADRAFLEYAAGFLMTYGLSDEQIVQVLNEFINDNTVADLVDDLKVLKKLHAFAEKRGVSGT